MTTTCRACSSPSTDLVFTSETRRWLVVCDDCGQTENL